MDIIDNIKDLTTLGLITYFTIRQEKKDKTIIFNGNELFLKKGSVLYSQLKLSIMYGVSIGKINKSIKLLKKLGYCENKNSNKFSIIELKSDFIFYDAGKQNENKMKTQGNIINYNNYNNNNIIFNSKNFEDYYFKKTGKKESIDNIKIEIDFEDFKKAFDLYIKVLESDLTYMNFRFGLRQFIISEKGFKKYHNANFDDFIDSRKQEEFEYRKTKVKREKIINNDLEKEQEMSNNLKNRLKWLSDFKKSNTYLDNVDNIRLKVLSENKNAVISESIFLACENVYIRKNYNCPY